MSTTVESSSFHAQAYFVHDRNLFQYLPEIEVREFDEWVSSLSSQMHRDGATVSRAERVVTKIYESRPDELAVWLMSAPRVGDSSLVTMTQAFNFRKLDDKRRAFRAPFAADGEVMVEGEFSTGRCVGDTGYDLLLKKRRVTILGHARVVEAEPKLKIDVVPLFMGVVVERPASEGRPVLDFSEARREIWPAEIDEFSKVKNAKRPSAAMLKEVSNMPENEVKHHFATIIGESYVGKDWGGETSDLFSARLHMSGKPISVAFAFKGPALKKRLTIAGMGTNGDQGLRLFHDPIDVGVVQHHREIDPHVRNLLEAVARQKRSKFMIIDGATTAQILHAYGHLSQPQTAAEPQSTPEGRATPEVQL